MATETVDKFLRRSDVESLTGLSRSTIYAQMAVGSFPRPRQVGGKAVRWVESEVRQWMNSRPTNVPNGA